MTKKKTRVETLYYTQADMALLWEARAIKTIWMESTSAHFHVAADLVSGARAELVETRHGRARHFLNPAAALMLLKRMGVTRVEVRMEEWNLEMAALSMRMRPDVVARRRREKRVREAVFYPRREPEPEIADRKDQLHKLIVEKMDEAGRRAGNDR